MPKSDWWRGHACRRTCSEAQYRDAACQCCTADVAVPYLNLLLFTAPFCFSSFDTPVSVPPTSLRHPHQASALITATATSDEVTLRRAARCHAFGSTQGAGDNTRGEAGAEDGGWAGRGGSAGQWFGWAIVLLCERVKPHVPNSLARKCTSSTTTLQG